MAAQEALTLLVWVRILVGVLNNLNFIYTMQIKYKRLSEKTVAPTRAYKGDAGWDLTATRITTELNECGQLIITYHTDLAVEIPEGYYGMVVPRSSIYKKSLRLTNCAGIIDSGYRGEIMGKFTATTDVIPAVYKEGERFLQLLVLPIPEVEFEESEELTSSDRGEGGYGSSNREAEEEKDKSDE